MTNKFEGIIEIYSLRVFQNGCEPKNYQILAMLPSTFNQISKSLGIKKMSTARRLNLLLKFGLLEWEKRKGILRPTPLTKEFINIIENIKKGVKKRLPDVIPLILEK